MKSFFIKSIALKLKQTSTKRFILLGLLLVIVGTLYRFAGADSNMSISVPGGSYKTNSIASSIIFCGLIFLIYPCLRYCFSEQGNTNDGNPLWVNCLLREEATQSLNFLLAKLKWPISDSKDLLNTLKNDEDSTESYEIVANFCKKNIIFFKNTLAKHYQCHIHSWSIMWITPDNTLHIDKEFCEGLEEEETKLILKKGEGIAGIVIANGKTYYSENVTADDLFLKLHPDYSPKYGSLLCVPIPHDFTDKPQMIGLLNLQGEQPNEFGAVPSEKYDDIDKLAKIVVKSLYLGLLIICHTVVQNKHAKKSLSENA